MTIKALSCIDMNLFCILAWDRWLDLITLGKTSTVKESTLCHPLRNSKQMGGCLHSHFYENTWKTKEDLEKVFCVSCLLPYNQEDTDLGVLIPTFRLDTRQSLTRMIQEGCKNKTQHCNMSRLLAQLVASLYTVIGTVLIYSSRSVNADFESILVQTSFKFPRLPLAPLPNVWPPYRVHVQMFRSKHTAVSPCYQR